MQTQEKRTFRGVWRAALARLRQAWATPAASSRVLTWVAVVLLAVTSVVSLLWPMLRDFSTYGFHDWDVETSYRYITVVSLKQYHEAPWWHPWLCGGFPAFGHVEGATNFVSPYLPLYLFSDIRTAIRLEVLGATLTGFFGALFLARRFTKSLALAAFVGAIYVLNGRWSLQLATGHTWHQQYAWLPWVLLFFERSQERGKLHNALYGGALMGLIVFMGGIYPLPHTALVLSCYALFYAAFSRSLRPVYSLALTGVSAIGFAAPKLFAIVDTMGRAPRLIESKETIGIAQLLVMLTDRSQSYSSRPVSVPAYGWHEWGIYIGVGALVCLVLGFLFARGPREHALRLTGMLLLFLGFGAFHENSPWAQLHKLPVFASQHVPSRFHFPMLLVLGLVFAAWVGRALDRQLALRPWLDLALLGPLVLVVADMVQVSHRPFGQAFWMEAPDSIEPAPLFEHYTDPQISYKRRDWAAPMLLAMMKNEGVLKCYGIDPGFDGVGAKAKNLPGYQGAAYVEHGEGKAEVIEWSPNHARIRVTGAKPDALVVYNMNWDPSWRVDGAPALDYQHRLAVHLAPGKDTVEFSYFPRSFSYSLPLFGLTVGLSLGVPLWWRRRKRKSAAPAVALGAAVEQDTQGSTGAESETEST